MSKQFGTECEQLPLPVPTTTEWLSPFSVVFIHDVLHVDSTCGVVEVFDPDYHRTVYVVTTFKF